MDAALPLLPMRPLFFEKLWGGERLVRVPGKGAPSGPVGESWEVADLEEGETLVARGPFEGERLGALVRRFGAALVGARARPGRFPLLVKLIDASDDLSVQVHPGPENAHLVDGARSKDEAWLVIEADEGARVLHGFREGVDEAAFRQAIEEGRADALLRSVPVRPGDALRIEPGVVHAIGRGVFLLEVQEPSDTTFRVWDFGRSGLDGRPRPLHIEEALKVAHFGPQPAPRLSPHHHEVAAGARAALLVDAPGYRLEHLELDAGARIERPFTGEGCAVVVLLEGVAALTLGDAPPLPLLPLSSAVVPAAGGVLAVQSDAGARLGLAGLGGVPLFPPR